MRPKARRAGVTSTFALAVVLTTAAAAAVSPVVQVKVTREGVSETLQVGGSAPSPRALEQGAEPERLELAGDGWQLRGAAFADEDYGSDGLVARGVIFTGTVGIALGIVNSSEVAMDVQVTACLNHSAILPPASVAVYGGSIAGSLLDGDGDGAATVTNDSSMNPFYQLRTDSAACNMDGTLASVATLYDHESTFSVASTFGAVNVPESFFGSPIPAATGPVTATTFELVLRFSVTPGDFVGFTATGVMLSGGDSVTAPPEQSAPAPRDLTDAPVAQPGFELVARTGGPPPQPLNTIGFAIGRANDPGEPAGPDEWDYQTTLPLLVPISPISKNGGTIVGSVTDTSGVASSCTVDTVDSRPYYAAQLDGSTHTSLYPHESSHIVGTAYRSVLIPPSSFGVPIPSANGPDADTSMGLNLHFQLTDKCLVSMLAIYVLPPCPPASYDVDGNGTVGALTDGILILRWLFGFSGSTLVTGVLGSGATRTDPADIDAYLTCLAATMLDIDGDGLVGPLTDGLLLLRYLFGFTDGTLIASVVGSGCTRCTAMEVSDFMDLFLP